MPDAINLSERQHPLYKDKIEEWEFFRDATKGGKEFAENNLFTHRLEDADDLSEREDRAYYLNYCDTIPDIYNSYIFRENIKRPPDKNLVLFRENVDRKGTNISEFIKKAGRYAAVYGVCHIIVDIPEINKKSPSVADVKNEKTSPFCFIILPTQLKDWSTDDYGNFRWICYEYQYYKDIDPKLEREEETHYKVITTEEWWIEDKDGNKVTFEDKSKSEGKNSLGFIPIYTLYHKEGEDDKVGESILKDIAYINRIVLNWCSLIDEQIERQTFSQLIVPDDSAMDEDEQRGADTLDRISTSVAFTFNGESRHPPSFISPETETINTIWRLVLDHVREMFRLAGLQGGTSDLYTSRSGRQSQMSFKSVDSSLAEKALTYQKCENFISKLAYLQLGVTDLSKFENVKYPTTFNTVALAEEIDSLLKIMERNFSETLNKTLMKDIARKAISVTPESTKEQIENEIDAGDGQVDSIQNALNVLPEKQGDGNPNTNQEKSFKSKQQVEKEQSQHMTEK